jgi:hypothetical protein
VAPGDLLDQAVRNMLDAPSKRLVGRASIPLGSQEFEVVYVGRNARGTQTSRALGLVIAVQFVKVDESLYINADEHYWQAYVNLEQLHLVVGKWVRVAADNPNHSDLLVLEADPSRWEPIGVVTQVGTDTIDGTPAVRLQDSQQDRFAVAAVGTPYLLRFEGKKSTEAGDATVVVTFSDFDAVAETIAAPTGEIVELG